MSPGSSRGPTGPSRLGGSGPGRGGPLPGPSLGYVRHNPPMKHMAGPTTPHPGAGALDGTRARAQPGAPGHPRVHEGARPQFSTVAPALQPLGIEGSGRGHGRGTDGPGLRTGGPRGRLETVKVRTARVRKTWTPARRRRGRALPGRSAGDRPLAGEATRRKAGPHWAQLPNTCLN